MFRAGDVWELAAGIQLQARNFIPFGVSAAFALEIYLKCLLLLEGRQISEGHDLKVLLSFALRRAKRESENSHNGRWMIST